MSTPAASVVVTSYNTPTGLLAISLSSILGQTLEDLELVLVIDGDLAPDSAELVESLRRADERLVVFQPGRVGRAQALNLGLDAARSPLIGIQDADDASHPRRLEIQSALLQLTPKLAVLGADARVSASVTARADWTLSAGDPKVFVVGRSLLRSNPVVHSSVLARREALLAVGGYDERRKAQFDYDLLLRLKAQGLAIGHCDLPLVLQRRGAGQPGLGLVSPAAHPHQPVGGSGQVGLLRRRRGPVRLPGRSGHGVAPRHPPPPIEPAGVSTGARWKGTADGATLQQMGDGRG